MKKERPAVTLLILTTIGCQPINLVGNLMMMFSGNGNGYGYGNGNGNGLCLMVMAIYEPRSPQSKVASRTRSNSTPHQRNCTRFKIKKSKKLKNLKKIKF